MAKSKKQEQEETLPEGFMETSLSGPQNWVKLEEGLVIHGELIGRHERRSDPGKFFYNLKLQRGVAATRGAGEEKEVIDVPPGDTVCFDERANLRDLATLIDSGKRYDVYIKVLGKKKMKTSQGTVMAWDFKVGHKLIAGSSVAARNGAMKSDKEDDIAF
jgi:hypothetical protein